MEERDLARAARLLLLERDEILPLLRGLTGAELARPTVLPTWSVRDVVAHCAAALSMTAAGTGHGYSPAENDGDVQARRAWPVEQLLGELSDGYSGAAAAISAADGRLDGLALGEWVHGGDIRDALGRADAYASAGIDDALVLLAERSRLDRFRVPPTRVVLTDRRFALGSGEPADAGLADLITDAATLMRLCAGREPDPHRYQLVGAEPGQYLIFG